MITYYYLLACANNNNWTGCEKLHLPNIVWTTTIFLCMWLYIYVWRMLLTGWRIDLNQKTERKVSVRNECWTFHYKYRRWFSDHICNNIDRCGFNSTFLFLFSQSFISRFSTCQLKVIVFYRFGKYFFSFSPSSAVLDKMHVFYTVSSFLSEWIIVDVWPFPNIQKTSCRNR